ncbi:MAG TPA: acetyl-CoA C-acetyltransferase [Candidatus Limnocylindrales bacterium]|nr:acetyl-CoA C-acetyltransferase [Candidatus Limnocylindrales bacterium]
MSDGNRDSGGNGFAGSSGQVFLVSAARTPIGKFSGSLADVPATTLGSIAIRAAVDRAGVPDDAVDEVIMGQVIQAGSGQAPTRIAALKAGLSEETSATTINKVCGSGLKAVMLAASQIRAGDAELIVAGGMENMNQGPYLLPKARFGYRLGNAEIVDATVHDGLWCATELVHMGTHAERVAAHGEISREDQDRFAFESHQKAIAAIDEGRFEEEIVPVPVRRGREESLFTTDEGPRRDTTLDALGRLKPAFELPAAAEDEPPATASVTAGNAPGITDGAAATVVASERAVERLGLRPMARIVGYSQADLAPRWLFVAPIKGVQKLLARIEMPIEAFDLIEINEAFAAQVLADGRELGFDWGRVNVNGGAIALGHPIGASGARIVATLLHELRRREGRYGLATLCLGGGGSVAMAFERA